MTTAARSNSRLSGGRLILLHGIWGLAAVAYTALFCIGTGQELERARQEPSRWLEIVLAAYYLALALFIFWRRSDDWIAGILSITFMMALASDNLQAIFGSRPFILRLDLILNAISSSFLLSLFYVFPDGRFVPRWTRWTAIAVVGVQLWRVFFEHAYMERGFALVGLLFFTAPVAQIYRYFRASDAVQRQQIKWVVLGLAVTVPPLGIALVLYSASGSFEMGAGAQVGYFLWTAFLVIFPLSITISILRYRLWDIDLIIRKTLVYGVLSALLALVYFGSVVVLQALFDALIGSQSPVIIVLSTLLMAALFSPLRRQVQHLIDRRFFRSKYDATQALARFAKTARDEVEFEALTAALVSVVQETMQPDGATVWLRNVREGRKEIQWQQFGEVS